jgi:hypothetical protein
MANRGKTAFKKSLSSKIKSGGFNWLIHFGDIPISTKLDQLGAILILMK